LSADGSNDLASDRLHQPIVIPDTLPLARPPATATGAFRAHTATAHHTLQEEGPALAEHAEGIFAQNCDGKRTVRLRSPTAGGGETERPFLETEG